MARIAYLTTNGLAHDIRFVSDDYVAQGGELLVTGDVLPSVQALSDPAAAAAAMKDGQFALIDAQRDISLAEGTVSWNGKNWHIDQTFQLHLTGFVTAFGAGLLPPSTVVGIRTADNETLQLGLADLKALAMAVLTAVQQIWAASWTAKDAIK